MWMAIRHTVSVYMEQIFMQTKQIDMFASNYFFFCMFTEREFPYSVSQKVAVFRSRFGTIVALTGTGFSLSYTRLPPKRGKLACLKLTGVGSKLHDFFRVENSFLVHGRHSWHTLDKRTFGMRKEFDTFIKEIQET